MEYRFMWCKICKKDTNHERPNTSSQSYNDPSGWTCTECGARGSSGS